MRSARVIALAAGTLGMLMGLGQMSFAGQEPSSAAPLGAPRQGRRDRAEERLERMTARLDLTEEQRAKIRPILEEEVNQIKAVRADASLSPADRQARAREIRKATQKQINQILTPEQKERRKELRQKARADRQQR